MRLANAISSQITYARYNYRTRENEKYLNGKVAGFIASIGVFTAVAGGLAFYTGYRCISVLSSFSECPTEPPCECEIVPQCIASTLIGLASLTAIFLPRDPN